MQNKLLNSNGHIILKAFEGLSYSEAFLTMKNEDCYFVKVNKNLDHFRNEIYFQKAKIESAYVLKALDILKDDKEEENGIVYPLVPNSLPNVFISSTYSQKLRYIQDVAQAVCDIHSAGFYHGDVKLQNVLVLNNSALLCDFGTTRLAENQMPRNFGSLANHQPPDEVWNSSSDTYALGVMLYQSIFGYDFLKDFVFQKFRFPVRNLDGIKPDHYVAIKDLIRHATSVSASQRIEPLSFIKIMKRLNDELAST